MNTNTNNVNPADEVWALFKETDRRLKELARNQDESQRRIEQNLGELKQNLGGLGNSLGRLVESMFSAKLLDRFNKLGYLFNTQANHKKFYENKRVVAEADSILENGEYAMIVEVKTEMSVDDIDGHLGKIAIIRRYMNEHGDNRKLVGAVAGGTVPENVLRYAQKKGLFVLVQNGDSIEVAATPDGFKPHEW